MGFGEFGHMVIDGKRKKLYAFSMNLGYSRMRYVEFTDMIDRPTKKKMVAMSIRSRNPQKVNKLKSR